MDQDALTPIVNTEIVPILVESGWTVSKWGVVNSICEVPGFAECPVIMRYGFKPDIGLVEARGDSAIPLVTSRLTPPLQRPAHLVRPIFVEGSQDPIPLNVLITSICQSKIGIELDPNTIPMVDCVVFMPLPRDGVTYLAGRHDIGFREGAMVIIDRGTWNGSYWVTQPYNLVGNSLLIAPSKDMQVQVFSVDGVLGDGSLTPEVMWSNSVTVLAFVSDKRIPKILLINSNTQVDANMYSAFRQEGGFGRMGQNVDTGISAEIGELSGRLKYLALINIFTHVIVEEPRVISQLKQLVASLS